LGIETPDEESLQLTKKFQNTRTSLSESVQAITKAVATDGWLHHWL